MSFGKRHFLNSFADLPPEMRNNLIQMFPLVGLWAANLDLSGGNPAYILKKDTINSTLSRNIRKFISRPFIHDLLMTARHTTWPLPLPQALTFHHCQTTLAACAELCDPVDIGAMRIILIDLAEQVEDVQRNIKNTSLDPFFIPPRPWADIMRGATRALFQFNDPDVRNPDQPSAAIGDLAYAIGAAELLLQDPILASVESL